MTIVNFKRDTRISSRDRTALREFCSELGGDPVKLALRLGLKVFLAELLPDECGYIEFDEDCGSDSGYKIVVNSNHPVERQKFTVAHEIGHFVLHRGTQHFQKKRREGAEIFTFPSGHRSEDYWNYGDYPGWMEFEADQFAATVLLPVHLLMRMPEFLDDQPAALAKRLGLSVSFVAQRFAECISDGTKGSRPQWRVGDGIYRDRPFPDETKRGLAGEHGHISIAG